MQCPISGKTIDEKKEFPVTFGQANTDHPDGRRFDDKGKHYDEQGQRKHSAELNEWKQIVVTVDGDTVIYHAHVHGDHVPTADQIAKALATIGGK